MDGAYAVATFDIIRYLVKAVLVAFQKQDFSIIREVFNQGFVVLNRGIDDDQRCAFYQ